MVSCEDPDNIPLAIKNMIVHETHFSEAMAYLYYLIVLSSMIYIFCFRWRDYKPLFIKVMFAILFIILLLKLLQ